MRDVYRSVFLFTTRTPDQKEKYRSVKAEFADQPQIAKYHKADILKVVVEEVNVSSVFLVQQQEEPKGYQELFWAALLNVKNTKFTTTKIIWPGR